MVGVRKKVVLKQKLLEAPVHLSPESLQSICVEPSCETLKEWAEWINDLIEKHGEGSILLCDAGYSSIGFDIVTQAEIAREQRRYDLALEAYNEQERRLKAEHEARQRVIKELTPEQRRVLGLDDD